MKRIVVCIVLAICLATASASAAPFSSDTDGINRAALSVMMLEILDGSMNTMGTGSGFVAFDNRHLITNYHVIEGASMMIAYSDTGEKYMIMDVDIVDREKDIAIVEFYSPTDLVPLQLNESGDVVRASNVVAIGSPKGFSNTITKGTVSAVFESAGTRYIQFDASISSGSSGGGLFDDEGRIIGITTMSYNDGRGINQNLNFAVNIVEAIDLFSRWDGSKHSLAEEAENAAREQVTADVPQLTDAPAPTPQPAPAVTLRAGDVIGFGHYEQDNKKNNGAELIEWIVLDVRGSQALLISRYALDTQPYHRESASVTWETCSLRRWLNSSFLKEAFNSTEQAAILTAAVDNGSSQGYSNWDTWGGNDTDDKLFLLSYAEADQYFLLDGMNARVAPTNYAIKRGGRIDNRTKTDDGDASGWWWLRSPGYTQGRAAAIGNDGCLHYYTVYSSNLVVRPALWLDLDRVAGGSGW